MQKFEESDYTFNKQLVTEPGMELKIVPEEAAINTHTIIL